MTATTGATTGAAQPPVEMVTGTIDGITVTVPKGTLIIRAAELIGIEIPRFCDHPLLDPVAMCRMCLVEVAPGPPKPQPACAIPLGQDMEVKTQLTSEMANTAQEGVMEFILANHPLDCPICDKGGECPLQNQAMTNGRGESRFTLPKATFDKPINVSTQILLDRERCVNCARCTRFAAQIAGDPFIALLERGAKQQVGINPDHPFDSYFSGNTVQICPVGALTSARYRFRSRPFDLVSVPTVCEHCASGCSLRTDYRRSVVMRRLAWDDPEVNEEWNCDKGRFAFPYLTDQRLATPLIREDGELRPASWPEAIAFAANGLAAARGRAGVLTGGRVTLEDALAYSGFARGVLNTDNVDFRNRPASAEEAQFLAHRVAGSGLGVTYAELEKSPAVLLVALEPEEESPIIFLRLRKAVDKKGQRVTSIAPYATRGLAKLSGTLLPAAPGDEIAVLRGDAAREVAATDGAVILVGERAAAVPGLLSAVNELADSTGADLAWVPRRAGERSALDAGLLPGLLPGGRSLADEADRADAADAYGVPAAMLPNTPGLDAPGMFATILADAEALAAAQEAEEEELPEPSIAALVVGGVDPLDAPDPELFRRALATVGFVVSLEQRPTEVTALADVVLPVAGVTEKAGTFVDWEGRPKRFGQVLRNSSSLADARVLAMLADEIAALSDDAVAHLHRGGTAQLWDAIAPLIPFTGTRAPAPTASAQSPAPAGDGVRLATWRHLLDLGTMQTGEPYLAATAPPIVARCSAATAQQHGLAEGHLAIIGTDRGEIRLQLEITDMPDGVIWVPENSPGSSVRSTLGAGWGDSVRLTAGGEA